MRTAPEAEKQLLAAGAGVSFQAARRSGCLLVDRNFSTAVTCFMVPFHRVSVGCEADAECFRVAEEAVVRRFSKAALDDGTDFELIWEGG